MALRESGGVFGEHTASLYSAVARPFQSAFGELMYSTPFEQAAAIFHAIICDHAFVDGNKRTGSLAALFRLGLIEWLLMIVRQAAYRCAFWAKSRWRQPLAT